MIQTGRIFSGMVKCFIMTSSKQNPVQKNLWKFNKKKVHEDKTKYKRKGKWQKNNRGNDE
jgi:hypothetical protein